MPSIGGARRADHNAMRSFATRMDGRSGRRALAATALCGVIGAVLGLSSAAFASGDTTPPTTPTNMRVVSVAEQTVSIAWDASTDNLGVDHYTVYRDGNPINTSSSASYTDTGLWPHSTHTYYATASDAA